MPPSTPGPPAHCAPACGAPGDLLPWSSAVAAHGQHSSTDTRCNTCRYDHRVVLLEFGDVLVSSVYLGLVEGPEAAHHPHPALRRIHHGCCCCCLHRPSEQCAPAGGAGIPRCVPGPRESYTIHYGRESHHYWEIGYRFPGGWRDTSGFLTAIKAVFVVRCARASFTRVRTRSAAPWPK